MNPIQKEAYQSGLEHARKLLVANTDGVSDGHLQEAVSQAIRDINGEISKMTGRIELGHSIDYVEFVREYATHFVLKGEADGHAEVVTPIGKLSCWTWLGTTGKPTSSYTLDSHCVTVAEMKRLGLAQRPTTRNRK